jgi:GT2 family glycosyltransferase
LTSLKALEQQTFKANEIIVVIDGSTDNTVSLLKSTQFSFNNFRVIEQENQGRAGVRNSGAKHAQSELLVFLDDDMKPEINWLQAHVEHHLEHKDSILTAAAIDVPVTEGTDYQKFKAKLSSKWAKELEGYNDKPIPKDKVFITAANFSLPKSLFEKTKGFDEILNDGEDYDLAIRATRMNIPIFYNSNACAWHLEQNSCAYSIRRTRAYYHAGRVLLDARPEIYEIIFGHRRNMAKGWKPQLFKLFCSRFWIDSIDNNFWVWLPEKLRYKLYDIVLTANGIFFPEKIKL